MLTKEVSTTEISAAGPATQDISTQEMARSLWWGAALWLGSVALAVVLAIAVAPEADATGSESIIEHTFIGY